MRSRLGERPYFLAHTNGKAAVRVSAGRAAAGVHGWQVADGVGLTALLDGPSLLHLPSPTAESFAHKLGRRASGALTGDIARLFPPGHAESRAVERLADASPDAKEEILEELFREVACFSEGEVQILQAAELLLTPDLPHGPRI